MTRLRVHVMVRSGLPDPFVDLDESPTALVLDALAPDRGLADDDLGLPPPWHLGYRGLLVEQVIDPDPRFPQVFRFGTDALSGQDLNHRVAESLTDERLLAPDGPIGRVLPDAFVEVLPELLRAARSAPRVPNDAVDVPQATCDSGPLPDAEWWNDGWPMKENEKPPKYSTRHQHYNNCYNYATNQRTDTFAQPGWGAGLVIPSTFTGELVRLLAWCDNLYDAPAAKNTCPPLGHLVGLAVSLEKPLDYHWWRKNRDGYWSHKPGQNKVTTFDSNGSPISDPSTCERGVYKTWVGYMVVVPGRVRPAGWGRPDLLLGPKPPPSWGPDPRDGTEW